MEKGTFSNPYTYAEFQQLKEENNWHGGHVVFEESSLYYPSDGIQSQGSSNGCGHASGYGCGSGVVNGSGSGSGSGSGNDSVYLRAGSETIRPTNYGVGLNIVVAWGAGYFTALNKPSVSAALYVPGIEVALPLSASWDGIYRVSISGAINLVDDEGNVLTTYNISESYNVPMAYYS